VANTAPPRIGLETNTGPSCERRQSLETNRAGRFPGAWRLQESLDGVQHNILSDAPPPGVRRCVGGPESTGRRRSRAPTGHLHDHDPEPPAG
jgi:hypothetical protein